ncbi:MAG: CPBP family intramembrane glutamic endopeptidase [Bacteroidota bacterium]
MEINSTLPVENVATTTPTESTDVSLNFWGAAWLGLQFVWWQLLAALVVTLLGFYLYGMEDEVANANLLGRVGIPLSFLVATWILYKKRPLTATAFQWQPTFTRLVPLGTLILFSITYVSSELMTFLPSYDAMLASYREMFANISPIGLLIGGVIVGPVCEEIIFRGIILEGLSKKYRSTVAIGISALIFGLVHLQPLQIIGAFVAGLVFGWIYLKTQSLWIVILLHVANNAFSFALGDAASESTRTVLGNDILYVGSFSVALILAYLGYIGFQKVVNTVDKKTSTVNV